MIVAGLKVRLSWFGRIKVAPPADLSLQVVR